MSITYEEALATLQSMFGEPWNRDMLDTVLRYQKGHMENTVDMILRHGAVHPDILIDQIENGTVVTPNDNDPNVMRRTATTNAIDEQLARQLSQQQQQGSSTNERIPLSGKGKPTTLSDDFLRPPGYVTTTNSVQDDEALARMLQDELFTEELRRNPDFAHLAHGRRSSSSNSTSSNARFGTTGTRSTNNNNNNVNPATAAANRLTEFARSFTNPNSSTQQAQQQRSEDPTQSPNIMEKISELGDNAKRRLQLLAAQFNANNSNNNNNNNRNNASIDNDSNSKQRAPEFRSLLDNEDDNMELAARKDL
jgi:hypothetical protein